PAVTLPPKPCGLPMATTSWPTRSRPASPSVAAMRSFVSVRSTARSLSGSRPATVNRRSLPSENESAPPRARSTTCALVSRNPSGVIATALPAPRRSRTFATLGESSCATRVTTWEYASSASASVGRSLLTNCKPAMRRRYHAAEACRSGRQHDLAPHAPGLEPAVSLGGLAERQRVGDAGRECAGLVLGDDARELL